MPEFWTVKTKTFIYRAKFFQLGDILGNDELNEGAENQKSPDPGFKKVEGFLEEGEGIIEKTEERVEKELDKEEERLEKLEKQKAELDKEEEEVAEEIAEKRAKVEGLKEEEKSLKEAEEVVGGIRKEVKKKKMGILAALAGFKKLFRPEKPESIEYEEGKRGPFRAFYEDYYKLLLAIPFLLLLLAVVQISYQYNTTGDFVNRGVELKGGITLTIPEKSYDISELEAFLNSELEGDVSVRRISQTKGILIEASDISEDDLLAKAQEALGSLNPEDYSIEEMGSSLGSSFFSEIIKAVIIAFVLMAIVVFITFRVPAPCLAVILAALSDIIVTLAIFNLTGAKLGKGGIAAFLMLIGYSVDTDILLSTKVLKSKAGTVMSRIYSAMSTGLTMNITTIAAITIAMVFTTSEVIRQIMTILLIGLFVDIINTWIQNVGILRLYLERKGRKNEAED